MSTDVEQKVEKGQSPFRSLSYPALLYVAAGDPTRVAISGTLTERRVSVILPPMAKGERKSLWWLQWIALALTVMFLAWGTYVYFAHDKISRVGAYGDFVAGFAGAVAFLWLIAGYYLQREELELQRKELAATRKSLDLQKQELHSMATAAAAGQIATMLNDYRFRMTQVGLGTPENIPNWLVQHFERLGRTSRSAVPEETVSWYRDWREREDVPLQFLASIRMGAVVYARAAGIELRDGANIVEFIRSNDAELSNMPHISASMDAAREIAALLLRLEPWRRRAHERYVAARKVLYPNDRGHLSHYLEEQLARFEKENPL